MLQYRIAQNIGLVQRRAGSANGRDCRVYSTKSWLLTLVSSTLFIWCEVDCVHSLHCKDCSVCAKQVTWWKDRSVSSFVVHYIQRERQAFVKWRIYDDWFRPCPGEEDVKSKLLRLFYDGVFVRCDVWFQMKWLWNIKAAGEPSSLNILNRTVELNPRNGN